MQFDVSVSKFTQSVKVQYGEMFTLKPVGLHVNVRKEKGPDHRRSSLLAKDR